MTGVGVGVVLIAVGLVAGVVALVVLHVVPTGLSPVRNPVSQYGVGRYRAGYRVQTLAYAVAGAGAAIGLSALPGRHTVSLALCVVFAACRAAISWFPMDVPATPRTASTVGAAAAPAAAATSIPATAPTSTPAGRAHMVLATGAFLGVALAAGALSRSLARAAADATPAAVSGIIAVVMLVALLALGVDRRSGARYYGAIERVFYVAMTAWLVLVGVVLIG